MATFYVSKWYMDCVTPAGEVVVAYAAKLSWGPLSLRYAATLARSGDANDAPRSDATLFGVEEPVCTPTELAWGSERLGIDGCWTALAPPLRETIFESSRGAVRWTCRQPRARVRGSFRGAPLDGLGYAEHVELTLPPWSLPIDELRWGRFVGNRSSLVWVDWRGPHTKRIAALDGVVQGDVRIEDGAVACAAGRVVLSVEDDRVLRRGRLGVTALRGLASSLEERGIDLPVRVLQMEECKWQGRGTLRTAGETDHGAIIHEVVRWPPASPRTGQGA
jgi:hypothetical protein